MLNALEVILFLVSIVSIIILLIGLLIPKKVLWGENISRLRVVKIYLSVALISFILCMICINTNPDRKKSNTKEIVTQEEFVSYAKNIRGASFVKEMKINNNQAEITFYDSFESYKTNNPDSKIDDKSYKQYFSTGHTIEKLLVSEPARLLRQFPALNSVKMTLPFEGKTYSINLDRNELNKYIGLKIEDLKVEDKSWQKKFDNPYVYDQNKRNAFFKKFVTVQ
ncbi:hypothetical protein LKM00_10000 [Bacillus wiedmannii]|uniref:hypothetical protein n=1 Tax=Bacillus wiedmannii TaxID=1890302 RepID=UPI001E512BED|nr:hypothetical protein [Bacillus wiedmannii]MCC2377781.1 hypothetical protein [Bacillus wiedmannii]MCC2421189.1 hypothetical protein [Bacillus wiedmannii]MCU5097298.1 hypothetical protein [Bacillus wiedmannii]